MTATDIVILLLIGGGALMGMMRGFVCEMLSLIAWGLSVIAIRFFQAPVADRMTDWVGTSSGAAILSLAIVGGGTFAIGKLIAAQVGARTRSSALGPIDRMLGFGFGAVKGLIIATLVFLAFSLAYDTIYGGDAARPKWLEKSRTYPLLNATGSAVSEFIDARRRGSRPPTGDNAIEAGDAAKYDTD